MAIELSPAKLKKAEELANKIVTLQGEIKTISLGIAKAQKEAMGTRAEELKAAQEKLVELAGLPPDEAGTFHIDCEPHVKLTVKGSYVLADPQESRKAIRGLLSKSLADQLVFEKLDFSKSVWNRVIATVTPEKKEELDEFFTNHVTTKLSNPSIEVG